MYASFEILLIALLVIASTGYVARAAWRGIRAASRDDAPGCGGCSGCGGKSGGCH